MQALDKDEICLENVKLESKMKPRSRAESVGVKGGFEGREREKVGDYRYLLSKNYEHKFSFSWVER